MARATSRPAATATSASPWWSDFDNLRCSAGNVRTNRKDAARVLNTHPYQLADASCSGPACPLHVFPRYSCSRSLSMSSSVRVHPRWHPCRRREALRAVQRSDTLTDQRLSSRTATSAPQRRRRGLVPSRCPPTPQCPCSATEFVSATSNSKAPSTSTPCAVALPKHDGRSLNRFDGCATSYLRRNDPPAEGRPSPRPNPDRSQRGCKLSAPRRGSVIASRPSILTFMSNRTSSGHLE